MHTTPTPDSVPDADHWEYLMVRHELRGHTFATLGTVTGSMAAVTLIFFAVTRFLDYQSFSNVGAVLAFVLLVATIVLFGLFAVARAGAHAASQAAQGAHEREAAGRTQPAVDQSGGVRTPVGTYQTMDQMARVLGYDSKEALRKSISDTGGRFVLREHGWTYEADQ